LITFQKGINKKIENPKMSQPQCNHENLFGPNAKFKIPAE
jgi:hypothetical protein